jgi:hypothetical protein
VLSSSLERRRWWQGYEWSRLLKRLAIGLLAAIAVLLWAWRQGSERRAVQGLPEADRAALYRRTLDTLTTTCRPGASEGLHDFCRDQAELLLGFPECDEACRALARRFVNPTR